MLISRLSQDLNITTKLLFVLFIYQTDLKRIFYIFIPVFKVRTYLGDVRGGSVAG